VLGEAAAKPAQTKTDGSFEIRDLAPGRYTLRSSYSDEDGGYSDQREIEVGVHGLENVALSVERDSAIDGQIALSASDPDFKTKSIAVSFTPSGMTGDFRVTAKAPKLDFEGQLRPGELYRVSTGNLPADYYLKTIRVSGHDLDSNMVTAAGPHEKVELVLDPNGGHIDGTVFDHDQLASGYVLLVPEEANRNNSDLFRKTRSDIKGKFTLRGVPPGSYKLIAFEGFDPEELINYPDRLKEIEDRGESVTISEGGKYNPVLKLVSPD
jgi:hypothetical protein